MESDLIKKEEEYKRQNELLEKRSKELLEKAQSVKTTFESTIESLSQKSERSGAKSCTAALQRTEFGSKDNEGRGMLHFYKAQIKLLQNEEEKLKNELARKVEEVKKLAKANQNLTDEREKWFMQYNQEKNNIAKLDKQVALLNSKLSFKENENLALRREIEGFKAELKNTGKDAKAGEAKLARVLQETEKLQEELKIAKTESKETKEATKKEVRDATITLKQAQRHKAELLHNYKKQLQLVDNLKRQKACLESTKVLEVVEAEFTKLLDWKLDYK